MFYLKFFYGYHFTWGFSGNVNASWKDAIPGHQEWWKENKRTCNREEWEANTCCIVTNPIYVSWTWKDTVSCLAMWSVCGQVLEKNDPRNNLLQQGPKKKPTCKLSSISYLPLVKVYPTGGELQLPGWVFWHLWQLEKQTPCLAASMI